MTPVNMHKAKTEFSKLIARVETGEEIVIARDGEPVARIVPFQPPMEKLPVASAFGALKGQIWCAEDAFDPLSEEELRLWEDAPIEPDP